MSVYEERLAEDVEIIRTRIREVAGFVRRALQNSVRALLTQDRELATATILGDHAINRAVREIDHQCMLFVARHLPSAGHLRYVSAVRRLTVELERVGDYAVTIGRSAVSLNAAPPTETLRDVELMSDHAERVLEESLKAFDALSAQSARAVRAMADQTESTFHRAFVNLVQQGESGQISQKDLLAIYMVLYRLDRVSDQAKNICEETIFADTGESKPPKVYRIAFVDRDNGFLSRLAEAIARRDFPESGRYSSAGWKAGDAPSDWSRAFLVEKGLPVSDAASSRLIPLYDALADYHVIVGLHSNLRQELEELPFHTVLVEWDLGIALPEDGSKAPDAELMEAAYSGLSNRLTELMTTLRGPEAS